MLRLNFRGYAAAIIIVALSVSCGLRLSDQGGASISVKVGGALPRTSTRSEAPASRAVPFATVGIRIRAVEAEGVEHSTVAAYSPESGAAVVMGQLPIDQELEIYVEALDAGGSVITSWHTAATLAAGENSLSATLSPSSDAVASTAAAGLPASAPTADLARDATRFDAFSGLNPREEVHFIYDTGKAEFAYLEAYDSSWVRLTPVANDQADGWTVVTVPADGIVNIAVSNCVSSPGYPPRTISGFIQARKAYFFSPAGSGTGTSGDPATLNQVFIDDYSDNASLFLIDGDHALLPEGYISVSNRSVRIYGGFNSSSWTIRNTAQKATIVSGNSGTMSYPMNFYNGATGCIDGLALHGRTVSDTLTNSIGLSLSQTGTFIVHDCAIRGTESGTPSDSNSTWTYGANITDCEPEFSRCIVNGGSFPSYDGFGFIASGIKIMTSSSHRPFIHDCVINGGSISGEGVAETRGIEISGSAQTIISQCEIWGGRIDSSSGDAKTYGIDHQGAGVLTVASSKISGGYCATPNSATCFGFSVSNTNTGLLLGCTIDEGHSTGGGAASGGAAVFTPNTIETGTRIDACILFDSSQNSPTMAHYIIWQNGSSSSNPTIASISGSAFFGRQAGRTLMYTLGPKKCASLNDFRVATALKNVGDESTTVASQLSGYQEAPSDFDGFIKADWRPRPGAAYAGTLSGIGPADMGIEALIAQYPSLGLDLAGKARPAAWARGAYEPQ